MYDRNQDTICAPATVPGTGAISVIRVSGPDAIEICDKAVRLHRGTLSDCGGYTLHYGQIPGVDDVVVSVFRSPRSYTGEDMVEISCHASRYIADNILQDLLAKGCRAALPGEFTQRAFLHGKMDLAQAEAVADVIASSSAAAHRVAMNQLKGGFSRELGAMREELLKIASLMELELDFSEEEVEFADRKQLNDLTLAIIKHIDTLIQSFKLGNAIKSGIPVAIVGSTNTGKSTLLNCLLGEDRAIVSDIPGTTRDTVEETLTLGGVLFRFIDTAGLRETNETIERIGITRSLDKLGSAQIVILMLDAGRNEAETQEEIRLVLDKFDASQQKLLILVNKCDSVDNDLLNKFVISTNIFVKGVFEGKSVENQTISGLETFPSLPISAKFGEGVDALKENLVSIAGKLLPTSDETLVTNLRHLEALTKAKESLERVREGLAISPKGSVADLVDPGSFDTQGISPAGTFDTPVPADTDTCYRSSDDYTHPVPTDLLAQDLREAIHHLGSITGTISTPDILKNIFLNFCIGK